MTKPYDYEPFRQARLYYETSELVAERGAALRQLVGQRLRTVYAQWEAGDPSESGWWNNGPVIVIFENSQLELLAWKGGVAVAVDAYKLDLDEVIGEPEDDYYVIWRADPWTRLHPCRDRPLLRVQAIEATYEGSEPRVMGLALHFETATLCLYEGGDQTSLTWGPLPDDPSLQWHVGAEF